MVSDHSTKIWGEKNLGAIPKVMKEATMGYFREHDLALCFEANLFLI